MSEHTTEATALNEALHKALGCERVCETTCTHYLIGSWSLLGLANVAARNGGAARAVQNAVTPRSARLRQLSSRDRNQERHP